MIQFGNDKIKEIYHGSDKIKEVYHGSDLVWKMDSGIIQDGYWVHRDTAVKTYFGADADFINNGVMSRPDWLFDAVEIKLCSGINDLELTGVEQGGEVVGYVCLVFVDVNPETGEGGNNVLQSIDMSNTLVNTLGDNAFYSCTSLTSITLPEGLTSIGKYAFYSCALTSITLPEGLTSIEYGAFGGCTSLSLVTSLPTIPPSLGEYVFYDTHANLAIKVPSQSVNTYKTATNWNSYASIISAI